MGEALAPYKMAGPLSSLAPGTALLCHLGWWKGDQIGNVQNCKGCLAFFAWYPIF